jgi:hypothetical protein
MEWMSSAHTRSPIRWPPRPPHLPVPKSSAGYPQKPSELCGTLYYLNQRLTANYIEILRNKYLDELEESVGQAIILELLDYFQTNHTNPSPSYI